MKRKFNKIVLLAVGMFLVTGNAFGKAWIRSSTTWGSDSANDKVMIGKTGAAPANYPFSVYMPPNTSGLGNGICLFTGSGTSYTKTFEVGFGGNGSNLCQLSNLSGLMGVQLVALSSGGKISLFGSDGNPYTYVTPTGANFFNNSMVVNSTGANFFNNSMVVNSTGVGIGTVPSQKLEVAGNMNLTGTSWFGYNSIGYFGTGTVISTGSASDVAVRSSGNLLFSSGGTGTDERMRINTSGCVGIGTTGPDAKLAVYSPFQALTSGANQIYQRFGAAGAKNMRGLNIYGYNTAASSGWNNTVVRLSSMVDGPSYNLNSTNNNLSWIDFGVNEYTPYINLGFGPVGGQTVAMTLLNNGCVGIGCTHPQSLLAVKGTITAQAVTVTLAGDWSDYVFKNNYNLKPLSEVENYIKTNNHLEGIPTEKEVKAKGLHVGDMQAKLLQKVEELTLYAIEQNKKIEELAKANEMLMKKLDGIK